MGIEEWTFRSSSAESCTIEALTNAMVKRDCRYYLDIFRYLLQPVGSSSLSLSSQWMARRVMLDTVPDTPGQV